MSYHECNRCHSRWTHEGCRNSPDVGWSPLTFCPNCRENHQAGVGSWRGFWKLEDPFVEWAKEVKNEV